MADDLAFTRINTNMEADGDLQMVWLWDCGPPKPELPLPPKRPKGEDGDPDFDLAMIGFREALADYETALRKYRADKADYDKWQRDNGGPIQMQTWSNLANDALIYDAKAVAEGRQSKRRWYVSSRTRGYGHLKNHGLPKDMQPGHGHAAALRREAEGIADLELAKRRDPVFGEQETRP